MAKRVVQKVTFQIANVLYHAACLCGLIWQVTQISINFFHFDVIKDIKVLMPEEINDTEIALNICFENDEVLDYQLYRKVVSLDEKYVKLKIADEKLAKKDIVQNLTVMDRFAMVPNTSLINGYEGIEEFMIGTKYCYHLIKPKNVSISPSLMANVTSVSYARGTQFPFFDHRRMLQQIFTFWSYSSHVVDILLSPLKVFYVRRKPGMRVRKEKEGVRRKIRECTRRKGKRTLWE